MKKICCFFSILFISCNFFAVNKKSQACVYKATKRTKNLCTQTAEKNVTTIEMLESLRHRYPHGYARLNRENIEGVDDFGYTPKYKEKLKKSYQYQ